MDGLGRHEHRDLDRGLVLDAGEDRIPRLADQIESDTEEEPSFFSKWTLPIALFLMTVFTTLWAGAFQAYTGPTQGPLDFLLSYPETLWRGIPFAGALLFILTTHEFGHYLLSKIHRVPASLPLF
ncbi:MAG TPA: hypothetical protein VFX10_01895, partial [Nitrospira sp.]|nr:hypothetical protein [Nitrospira sp.]